MSKDPFHIEIGSNVQKFVFTDAWLHTHHYQAIFNGLDDVLANYMPTDQPWAMIGDWRRWLVQTPDSERVCVRCLAQLSNLGMTHYATVVEEHPIARWQLSKVKSENPALDANAFDSFDGAETWLQSEGFDCNFIRLGFRKEWLKPSHRFNQTLDDLNLDKNRFVVT